MGILSSSFLLICALMEAYNDGVYHDISASLLVVSVVGITVAIGALLTDVLNSLRALKIDIEQRSL